MARGAFGRRCFSKVVYTKIDDGAINLENLARVNFHLPKVLREVKPVDCRENQHNEDNPCCEGYRMKQELVGSHLSTN